MQTSMFTLPTLSLGGRRVLCVLCETLRPTPRDGFARTRSFRHDPIGLNSSDHVSASTGAEIKAGALSAESGSALVNEKGQRTSNPAPPPNRRTATTHGYGGRCTRTRTALDLNPQQPSPDRQSGPHRYQRKWHPCFC